MVKDYIDTNDFTKEELLDMVDLAIAISYNYISTKIVPASPSRRP